MLRFYSLDLDFLFKETPLQYFFNSIAWKISRWMPDHLSDLLRFGLIHKFGGFYSDLDNVILR